MSVKTWRRFSTAQMAEFGPNLDQEVGSLIVPLSFFRKESLHLLSLSLSFCRLGGRGGIDAGGGVSELSKRLLALRPPHPPDGDRLSSRRSERPWMGAHVQASPRRPSPAVGHRVQRPNAPMNPSSPLRAHDPQRAPLALSRLSRNLVF